MTAARLRPRLAISGFIAAVIALTLALPAVASAAEVPLTVEFFGTGTGEVECEVEGGGPEACAPEYEVGKEVTVLPVAETGSEFVEFFGDCGPLECELTMDEAHTVNVVFDLEPAEEFALNVVEPGTGEGEVECEVEATTGLCEAAYPEGTEVTLIATAETGSEFVEWAGECDTITGNECEVEMTEEKTVEVVFEPEPEEFALNIEEPGSGTGTVECELETGPEPCAPEYPAGTEVNLIATPETGSEFVEWSGCDTVSGVTENECQVEMSEEKTVEVLFELEGGEPKFKLTVTKSGTGTGTVKGGSPAEPNTINCGSGSGCEHNYLSGAVVTLTHEAAAGSEFKEWTGACTGSGTCEVTMSAAKSVGAKFDLEPAAKFKLTVSKSGTGTGTVKGGSPAEPNTINCGSGSGCEHEYLSGAVVTLTHEAAVGSEFKEWTGACTGSGTCEVTMSAAKSVGAKFDLEPAAKFKLTVSKSGTGTGTVKGGSPAEPNTINCGSGSGCEHEYLSGAVVTLTHEAAAGSEFKEWTGACTGSGTCEVTMSAAKSVGAKFDLSAKPKFKLTVSKSGSGSGTVTSVAPNTGISCGSTCSFEFEEGKQVELTQSADSSSEFKEWTGACTGSGTCKVTMSSAKAVGAVFNTKSTEEHKTEEKHGTTPPPPPPPPPAAGTALAAGTATVTSGKAAIKVTCTGGACSGSFTLTAKIKQGKKTKTLTIGKASFSLAAGASSTLSVKLSGPAKQELAKGKTVKAKLSGTGITAATVKLKQAKKK